MRREPPPISAPVADCAALFVASKKTAKCSIPTEADTTQKTMPLAAGAVALGEKILVGWIRLRFPHGQSGWVRKEEVIALWQQTPSRPTVLSHDGGEREFGRLAVGAQPLSQTIRSRQDPAGAGARRTLIFRRNSTETSQMNLPQRIRRMGAALLVGGLLAAIIIYATAKPDEYLGILGVDVPTNRDTLELERMGGKGYVMFHDFSEWFASLWHGRRLAYTVGVLAIGGFLGSRWLANFLSYPPAVEKVNGPNA